MFLLLQDVTHFVRDVFLVQTKGTLLFAKVFGIILYDARSLIYGKITCGMIRQKIYSLYD